MKIGTLVCVWRDNGQALLTRTRSDVQETGNGPAVWVNGIAGYYLLSHVRSVDFHESAKDYGKQEGK